MRFAWLLLCGCAFHGRVLTPTDLAHPQSTALTSYLRRSDPEAHRVLPESVPDELAQTIVIDEATVESWDGHEACVELVLRHGFRIDQPASQWEVRFSRQRVFSSEESLRFEDHPFRSTELVADALTVSTPRVQVTLPAFATHSEARDSIFRVAVHQARFCGPVDGKRLTLAVALPPTDGGAWWHERFEWMLP